MGLLPDKVSSMTMQDLMLVVLCALSIYLLRVRDTYFVLPTWRKDYVVDYSQVPDDRRDMMPRPLVVDLESDGINEIIVVTNQLYLEVLTFPAGVEYADSLLPRLKVKHEKLLHAPFDEFGRRPHVVAIETGYLSEFQIKNPDRQQVIVVLMDDWTVHCFTHDLKQLWRTQLMDVGNTREEYFVKSAGILVTSKKLAPDEHGSIIVGASFSHKIHGRGSEKEGEEEKPKEPIRLAFQSGKRHLTGEETRTHFSCFGLGGRNGTVRWHHLPGDFEDKKVNDTPPIHWKLGLQKSHHHIGEVHWSKYSTNLLKQLPHNWMDIHDTRFELANLRKTEHKKESNYREESTIVSDFVGVASEHVIGLAFGGLYPHSRHEHVQNPNALIIHTHNGIEVLNLLTGQPLTNIDAQDPQSVYVDVDGDGLLDAVRASYDKDKCSADIFQLHPSLKILHQGSLCKPQSWSIAMSGMFTPDPNVREDTHVALPPAIVRSIAIKSGPMHHLMGRTLPSERRGYDSIFLTSTGYLTSYGPRGDLNWQTKLQTTWAKVAKLHQDGYHQLRDVIDYLAIFKPSLTPFSLQIFGVEDVVLALGWEEMTVVDLKDGFVLSTHSLPCRPSQKPVFGDFNEDGWTDVIVICPQVSIGFTLHKQPNYIYMGIVSVTVVLAIVFLSWLCKPRPDHDDDDYDM